jgi:hypothetical protein
MSDSIKAIEYASSPVEHPALCQERRQDMLPKKSKLRRIPEEAGFVDGHQVDQLPESLVSGSTAEHLVVVVDLIESQLLHAGAQRRRQRGPLALVEMEPAPLLDEVAEADELLHRQRVGSRDSLAA